MRKYVEDNVCVTTYPPRCPQGFFFFCVMFIVYGGVVTYMRHYFIYTLLRAPSAPLSLGLRMHRQRPTLWWHPPTAQQRNAV